MRLAHFTGWMLGSAIGGYGICEAVKYSPVTRSDLISTVALARCLKARPKREPFERFFLVVIEKPLKPVQGLFRDWDHRAKATVLMRSLRASRGVKEVSRKTRR